mmetsp:Transcript_15197/g.28341  ORF Transcript_15197/g.28341 Transcript_15197/m.28341 type:complete len:227 (+) Transcript_15197:7-687(+)
MQKVSSISSLQSLAKGLFFWCFWSISSRGTLFQSSAKRFPVSSRNRSSGCIVFLLGVVKTSAPPRALKDPCSRTLLKPLNLFFSSSSSCLRLIASPVPEPLNLSLARCFSAVLTRLTSLPLKSMSKLGWYLFWVMDSLALIVGFMYPGRLGSAGTSFSVGAVSLSLPSSPVLLSSSFVAVDRLLSAPEYLFGIGSWGTIDFMMAPSGPKTLLSRSFNILRSSSPFL